MYAPQYFYLLNLSFVFVLDCFSFLITIWLLVLETDLRGTSLKQLLLNTCHARKLRVTSSINTLEMAVLVLVVNSVISKYQQKNYPLENAESGKCFWQVCHIPTPPTSATRVLSSSTSLTCAQTVLISWMMAVVSGADEGLHCTDCTWGGRNGNQNVDPQSQPHITYVSS